MAKSDNITWHDGAVTADQRRMVLGQRGCVIWLTGLSGSGKSTIAESLEERLIKRGRAAYVLDGDNIRHRLNSDLGFSPEHRDENIRRVGEVGALFADAGLIAIAAFISPYQAARDRARAAAPNAAFVEVFVDAPLEVCESRDPKGLYRKARAGEITDFTGIDAPYERPAHPEVTLSTGAETVGQCVDRIIDFLSARGFLLDGKSQ
jgi:adenylyl-sulfate kinase